MGPNFRGTKGSRNGTLSLLDPSSPLLSALALAAALDAATIHERTVVVDARNFIVCAGEVFAESGLERWRSESQATATSTKQQRPVVPQIVCLLPFFTNMNYDVSLDWECEAVVFCIRKFQFSSNPPYAYFIRRTTNRTLDSHPPGLLDGLGDGCRLAAT